VGDQPDFSFMYIWSVVSSGVGIFNVAASRAGNYVAALSVPILIRDLANLHRPVHHPQLFVAKRRKNSTHFGVLAKSTLLPEQ
jgi:hypothetical protein